MGIFNEKMAKDSTKVLINQIKMIDNLWEEFINLNDKIKEETIKWTLKTLDKGNGEIYMYDDEHVLNKFSSLKDCKINYNIAKYLSMFTYDYNTYELFFQKINTLKKINNLCFSNLKKNKTSEKYKIGNAVYNYKLGVKIPMINLCVNLKERGYGVLYENWNDPTKLNIMIPLVMVDNQAKLDDKNILAHRFQINQCGSVRQTSPTNIDTALEIRNMILSEIYDIITNESEENI